MLIAATISEQINTTQDFGVTNWCLLLLAKSCVYATGAESKWTKRS